MTCFSPLEAWRVFNEPLQKFEIVFNYKKGQSGERLKIPCGQCIGCRLEYARQWAMRCVHEASLHKSNSFITLTYNDDNLPSDGGLWKIDFQRFMKRLRQKVTRTYGKDVLIRFFHCGEYGSKNGRPHYHAIIFGFDFPDKVLWKITPRGDYVYRSKLLESVWKYGFSTIGEVTFESCAYVARYITKKIKGDKELAKEHYGNRIPEYTTMSRKPGIGQGWFQKYHREVYPVDRVVLRGREMKPPRYYDSLCQADPDLFSVFEDVQCTRQLERLSSEFNQLDDYEQFQMLQRKRQHLEYQFKKRFQRSYEDEVNE